MEQANINMMESNYRKFEAAFFKMRAEEQNGRKGNL